MKIIQPSVSLHTPFGILTEFAGIELLRHVERMARISHRSEDAQTEDSWRKFIPAVVIQHGDWSVAEHAHVTAIIRTDRGTTHELVRHRLFSFTQESTRFVNAEKKYPEGLEFILPIELAEKGLGATCALHGFEEAEKSYLGILDWGARPQEARSVLPNALAATIACTANLRSWRWLFLARTTKETHPDFRRLAIPMLKEFQSKIPILFDDIIPLEKQSISTAKIH